MKGFVLGVALACLAGSAQAQYLQPYQPQQQSAPSIQLGNPFGTSSNSPQIYDSSGQYRGNLNSNQFDPNSVSNPFGRYGSPFSTDSLNNPYSRR